MSAEDTKLAADIVCSITRNERCHLSAVARMLKEAVPLIDTVRRLSEHLADDESTHIVLLTNASITCAEDAEQIVLAYMRRWGSEEATRAYKQLTHVEDFRVRRWSSIRRMTFLAMMACGIQALMLLTRPSLAARYIARVKQFIDQVPFVRYRLWRGVADAIVAAA